MCSPWQAVMRGCHFLQQLGWRERGRYFTARGVTGMQKKAARFVLAAFDPSGCSVN
jgi:hypothetical protein